LRAEAEERLGRLDSVSAQHDILAQLAHLQFELVDTVDDAPSV
jgi:hypothetical protein